MLNRVLTTLLTIVAVAGFAEVAGAQYMYLDANGNGVYDTGDRLNANGTPTTVDLYVRTDQNRDGSTAECDTGDGPLTINHYGINLMAVGGIVSYSGFINQMPTFFATIGEFNPDGVRYRNGFGGQTQPPGQYRLCTLTITGVSGSPRVDIVDLVSGSLDFTGFGTQCSGHAFDNLYRLDGPNVLLFTGDVGDFFDWDGLLSAEVANTPPVLAAIGNKAACPGIALTFTATATDADLPADSLTFSLDAGAPAGASINASTGTFTWTPSSLGTFPVTVRVTDNGTPPLSDFETIAIAVLGAPVVLAPIGNKTANEGSLLSFTATATHPCVGAVLTFSLGAGSAGTITAAGVYTFTPSEAQGGTAPTATVIVTDNGIPPLSDSETITIAVNETNLAPVLATIGNRSIQIGVPVTFTATATDADLPAQTLTFSLELGTPPATGATINPITGAFSWTPTTSGQFPVTVRVTDNGTNPANLSDSEAIIFIGDGQQFGLAAIGNRSVNEGASLTFTATAFGGTPPYTFSLGAGSAGTITPAGVYTFTPSEAQGGTNQTATIIVTDNFSPPGTDSEAISIAVIETNQPPVLALIGNKTVDVGSLLAFTAAATDADLPAQAVTFSLGAGSIGAITPGGVYSFTPSETQGGTVQTATIIVTDNGLNPANLSDSEMIAIVVREPTGPPVLAPIGDKTVSVGSLLTFTATATDPDLPPQVLIFSLDAGAPPGATINFRTGAFSWIPTFAQVGGFPITVRVTDNGIPPLSDFETITVQVILVDGHPRANAGGPYTGIVNSPVTFNGAGSSDPAGEALTYAWNFGDGSTGTGATPMHTYTAPGTYNVALRVMDPLGNFDDDVTIATIERELSVSLLLKKGKSTIQLDEGGALKVGIEQTGLQYSSVIVGSLRISTDFPNAGTVAECAADTKHSQVGDLDRNGVPDLEVRFSMDCVRDLFRNTPNNSSANLIITGEFQTPAGTVPLRGVKVVAIKRGDSGNPALAYPNPFNPQSRLSFVTTKAGNASILLFDLQGRLVRTLMPEQHLVAGDHEVAIDGRNDQGLRLPSGVYFYRVLTADGVTEGSISVLK